MTYKPACLVLSDGHIFEGYSIGVSGSSVGELVFNTAMTGYQEILSDPSYAKQIVTLTAAHVGNTGCNADDMESRMVWASGLVIKNVPGRTSSYRAEYGLEDFLKKHQVVGIAGCDTRHITQYIRDNGVLASCITTEVDAIDAALDRIRHFNDMGTDITKLVSRQTSERWYEGQGIWGGKPPHAQKYHVVAYDFGVKHSILRILYDKGCHITLVPAHTEAKEVLELKPDGILLSNGPGDPAKCHDAIAAVEIFLKKKIPLLGICLGFQILGIASGGHSTKMKFGHHGANHPVLNTDNTRHPNISITSQNHNFSIDEATLPGIWEVTHRSLFDGTLQGIRHRVKPIFGVQGHPEANPGPHDMESVFDEFIIAMGRTHT